tara:strand:- start:147 stop:704 length:558 start_codon:yes stop_codon:yes gene_type:complete
MNTPSIKDYIFYKIFCLNDAIELSYIGSTADWKTRKYQHKYNCNNENGIEYNFKVYKTIRENGGWNNFKMIEIGKQEQLTPQQAKQIEEQYRVELNANMNGRSCFRTEEERIQLKKEYDKEYVQTDKAKTLNNARSKKWRDNNKEQLKAKYQTAEYKTSKAERNKKYRDKKKLEKQQKDITITTF